MATKPVRVPADLFDDAVLAGEASSRSAAQQIDYWARVGREVAMAESAARDRILNAVAGRSSLSSLGVEERVVANAEIDTAIETTAASVDFAAQLAAEGVATVTMDADGQMIRRDPDGTRTVLAVRAAAG